MGTPAENFESHNVKTQQTGMLSLPEYGTFGFLKKILK